MDILYVVCFCIVLFFILIKILSPKIVEKKPKFNTSFYRVIYSDAPSKKNAIYYIKSEKFNLRGKPDFILKNILLKRYIPVELKSGKLNNRNSPHFGDLMQLICYFVMIEEFYKCKVPYGKLIYADKMFIIKNTKHQKKILIRILNDMQNFNIDNCTDEPDKKICQRCQYKHTICTYYAEHQK